MRPFYFQSPKSLLSSIFTAITVCSIAAANHADQSYFLEGNDGQSTQFQKTIFGNELQLCKTYFQYSATESGSELAGTGFNGSLFGGPVSSNPCINVDGDLSDFTTPVGFDNGILYLFASDADFFYIGAQGIDLVPDDLHIVFSNSDGSTGTPRFGVDFNLAPWTYMISFFDNGNICYFPFDDPFNCQFQPSWGVWDAGAQSLEIAIPRAFLGSYIDDVASPASFGIFASNNVGDFVFSTHPNSNPTCFENPPCPPNQQPWQAYDSQTFPTPDLVPPTLNCPSGQTVEWGDQPDIDPCLLPDNGTGTVDFPPDSPCSYVGPMIIPDIQGASTGTQMIIQAFLGDPENVNVSPGGFLGGESISFEATLFLVLNGTGDLAGYVRTLFVHVFCTVDRAPFTPGGAVQDFDNEMVSLSGDLFGDPDFQFLGINGGAEFGGPGGGHTTLTRLGSSGGPFQVDSFFDITYQIDFQGVSGGILDGMSTPPTSMPQQTNLSANSAGTGIAPATATDNCAGNVALDFSDGPFVPATGPCTNNIGGTITRDWIAVDVAGNSASCSEVITVLDTTPPDIDCPPAVTVEWGDNTEPDATPPGDCEAPDNGNGTVTMVPVLCTTPFGFEIFDGLPSGSSLQFFGSVDLPFGVDEQPGGNLFGTRTTFEVFSNLTVIGTGALSSFVRTLSIQLTGTADFAPRNPGDPVQTFPNEMVILEGELFGDPDFEFLSFTSGTGNGLPAPGSTTLTQLPSGNWNVDSFFDIDYQIDFVGASGGALNTFAGFEQQSGRLQTGGPEPPQPGTGFPTGTDNCTPSSSIIYAWSDVSLPTGSCNPSIVLTRTFTATDNCGNQSSCPQIINIVDTSPPVMVCPPTVTVEWGDPQDPPITGVPFVMDNCDPSPAVTHSDVTMNQNGCTPAIIITRTFTATDLCTNAGSCTQIVNIEDTSPPAFTKPNDVQIEWPSGFNNDPSQLPPPNVPWHPTIDPSCFSASEQFGPAVANWYLDAPAGDDVMQSTAIVQIDVGGGPIQITLNGPVMVHRDAASNQVFAGPEMCEAIDNGMNDVMDTEIIEMQLSGSDPSLGTVILRVGPTITTNPAVPPSIGKINGQVPADDTLACSFFDVFFEIEVNIGGTPVFLYNQVALLVRDTIDRLPPLAIYVHLFQPGLNVDLWTSPVEGEGIMVGTLLDAVHKTNPIPVTDNCDALPTVNFQDELLPSGLNCPDGPLMIRRTWTAVDDCLNLSLPQFQFITFTDTTPPDITCPGPVTVEFPGPTDPPNTGFPTATDNCDPNPAFNFSDSSVPGTPPVVEVITRTWTATDLCGNESDPCDQIITVTEEPVLEIFCPDDVTIEWGDPEDPPNTGGFAQAAGGCLPGGSGLLAKGGGGSINFSDHIILTGNCPVARIIERTWTANDGCTTVTCLQTISVTDLTPPVFDAPNDVTIEWPPDFNLDPVPPNTPQDPSIDPSCLPADQQYGPAVPNWYLDQPAGSDIMQSTAIITVDLVGVGPVQLTMNGPVRVDREASDDLAVINPSGCSATANGQNDVIQTEIISMNLSGSAPGFGNVNLRVGQDASNPAVPPSQGVIIGSVPADNTLACSHFDVFFEVEVSIPGGPTLLLYNQIPLRVRDTIDRLPPLAIYVHLFQPGLNVDLYTSPIPGQGQIFGTLLDAVHKTNPIPVTDNCDPLPVVTFQDQLMPSGLVCPFGPLVVERTWIAVDLCGNPSLPQIQTITFEDTSPPEFTPPNDVTIEWPPDFNLDPVSQNTPQDPSIDPSCLDPNVQFNEHGEFWFEDLIPGFDLMQSTAIVGINLGGPTPNCALPAQLQVSMHGPVQVNHGASLDVAYNGVCGAATVDGSADVIQTEIVQMELTGSGVSLRVGAGNNAGPQSLPPSLGIINGADPPDPKLACSTFDVFFEVEISNPAGGPPIFLYNLQPLTVIDTIDRLPPLAIYVHLFTPGQCVALYDATGQLVGHLVDAVHKTVPIPVTDNCDPLPAVNFQDNLVPSGQQCPIGPLMVERTWIAVDACGNESDPQVQTITFTDTTPPVAVCQNIIVQLGPNGTVTITPQQVDGGSTDNCGISSMDLDMNLFDISHLGPNTVVLTVTDICGLTSTCTAVVTVEASSEVPVEYCLKVYLYALFNPFAVQPNPQMLTTLNTLGILPANQPFSTLPTFPPPPHPLLYSGPEAFTGPIPPDVSDWLLLRIRAGSNPALIVAEEAVVVRSDGSVTSVDGSNPTFQLDPADAYYVELLHLNHLPISSNVPLPVDPLGGQICHDFTTSMDQAFRNIVQDDNPMTGMFSLNPGIVFGMIPGNVQNLDCQIDINDFAALFPNYLMSGIYDASDVNRDGTVDANDLNLLFLFYNSNAHKPYP